MTAAEWQDDEAPAFAPDLDTPIALACPLAVAPTIPRVAPPPSRRSREL